MPVLQQRGKVVAALLMALGLCALSARAVDEPQFTYYYQMEKVDPQGMEGYSVYNAYYHLYVARQGDGAPPLHAGSIALATVQHKKLQFDPAEHWTILPQERTGTDGAAVSEPESGTATEERETYLSFNWGVKQSGAGEEGYEIPEEADGRQYIGMLTVLDQPAITLDELILLPWPETETGAARFEAWDKEPNAARKKALLMALETTWRMDDDSRPADGYFQGYYQWSEQSATEGGAPTETQRAVDIQNGWQKFRVQSYNPFKDVTLTATDAAGVPQIVKFDNTAQGSQTPGRVTFTPDLSLLELENGTYTLKVSKPSHVSITYTGLTVSGGKVFPELTGKLCYLPCGDVTGGVDGAPDERIKQADRAYLTRPQHYGKRMEDNISLLDLDGDGHIGQRDLAILTAPANYGKSEKKISMASGTKGGTT